MDRQTYFRSLGQELSALKTRVRDLMDSPHWLTEGEWKESVLRAVLRRHLPATAIVGRGFVLADQFASHQLDILIHDASRPVLFKDGDLVFVTPDAVLGIIEVKSMVTATEYRTAVRKVCTDIGVIRRLSPGRAFAGLFAFEAGIAGGVQRMLAETSAAAATWNERLDFGVCGESAFIRYWDLEPRHGRRFHRRWHGYDLPGMAAAYFIHNVIEAVSPQSVSTNSAMWFPPGGKDPFDVGSVAAAWAESEAAIGDSTIQRQRSRRKRLL
jgi:hypothetical protein